MSKHRYKTISYLIKKIKLFDSNLLILYYNVIGIPFATSKGDNKSIVRLPSLVRGMSNPYHSLSSLILSCGP
jgi:hypothetical protein